MSTNETDIEFEEILEWKIENYSSWSHEIHGIRMECPKIFLYSSSGLELFPRGLDGQQRYTLVRVFEVWLSESSETELSIVGANGRLLFKSLLAGNWDENLYRDYNKYKEIVIPNTWNDDALTLRLRLNRFSNAFHRVRTVIEVFDKTFEVPPVVFENVSVRKEELVSKSHCSFNGTAHMIVINAAVDPATGKVVFKMESTPKAKNMILQSCIDIFINNAPPIVKERKLVFDGRLTISLDLSLPVIRNRRVSATWRLKIVPGSTREVIDFSHSLGDGVKLVASDDDPPYDEKAEKEVETSRVNNAVLDLSKDLMSLFQNQEMPDFTLRCGRESFPAHKNILCARSPVFKAMLNSGMAEGLVNEVNVEDMDSSTLKEFLLFLYSGTVEDTQFETYLKLYYAADKYQVSSLKSECSDVLGAKLSVSNVCDVLLLGDRHSDDSLVSVARDFISKNCQEVLRSDGWVVLMGTDPNLACRTVTEIAIKENCEVKIKPREYCVSS